jgi:hypothetical protein
MWREDRVRIAGGTVGVLGLAALLWWWMTPPPPWVGAIDAEIFPPVEIDAHYFKELKVIVNGSELGSGHAVIPLRDKFTVRGSVLADWPKLIANGERSHSWGIAFKPRELPDSEWEQLRGWRNFSLGGRLDGKRWLFTKRGRSVDRSHFPPGEYAVRIYVTVRTWTDQPNYTRYVAEYRATLVE